MLFVVYILLSESTGKYYTGQTHDLMNRLSEHNSGETKSVKNGIPWKLVWSKGMSTRGEAIMLETKIKKRGAKRFLVDMTQ
jgi:putative endonuclease